MELLKAKEKCCGCAACAHVCPVNAIQMERDDEGFLYPEINHSLCIDCGACKATCEFQKETPPSEGALKYGAFRAPTEVRKKSQSGALFYEAARAFLNNGGVVYGAVLEKNFSVGFARAASLEQLEPMRGCRNHKPNGATGNDRIQRPQLDGVFGVQAKLRHLHNICFEQLWATERDLLARAPGKDTDSFF